ncbi:MAG: UvrD-helicase domain-containing protein [Deltaproteobacteria bacterium]|nr:UvrD-helicase domain-containing protein [Deltaproteobacteria bacterium]
MSHFFPRPPILDQIPLDRPAVIEASAGTGKTYTLEHLVLELILTRGLRLEELLIVTFTEKAASELKGKLRRRLEEMLRPGTATEGWRIGKGEAERVLAAIQGFDAATICTIHAFCQRLLVENAFAHRRLFEQALVDARGAFLDAFFLSLRDTLAKDSRYRSYLDAYLGQWPVEDLGELLFDVNQRRGAFSPVFDEGTFRHAMDVLSKLELGRAALGPALRSAGINNLQMVNAIFDRLDRLRVVLVDFHQRRDLPAALLALGQLERSKAGGFFGFLAERLKAPQVGLVHRLAEGLAALERARVPFESAIAQLFLPVVEARLVAEKDRAGLFDFDDMLRLLEESLTGPDGGPLTELVRKRHRYALIDEFQDTDEIQWSIFRHLFLSAGPRHGLFVIGDPKQAIYGFRGADVFTYLEAKRIIAATGTVVPLVDSYRQSPALVATLNRLFDPSHRPSFFTGAIGYEHPVRPGKPKVLGMVHQGIEVPPIALCELVPAGGPVSATRAKETYAEWIAQQIRGLLEPGATQLLTPHGAAPLSPKEIFVLTRTGREGRQVADRLRAHQIPLALYQQEGLFQTQEAKDVLALLSAIAEPDRRSRRVQAFQTPFFAVPLAQLAGTEALPADHPLLLTLYGWKELATARRFDELYRRILDESGIVDREILLAADERELTNYLHLFELLLEDAGRRHATLPELVRDLAAYVTGQRQPVGGNVERQAQSEDAVQIMTMHKAKGLEAAVVFLFGGLEPARAGARVWHEGGRRLIHVGEGGPSAAETEAWEEDQRLLYVALTRAKTRLFLPYFGGLAEGRQAGERSVNKLEGTYRHLVELLDREAEILAAGQPVPGLERLLVPELVRRPPRNVAPPPTPLPNFKAPLPLLVPPFTDPRLATLKAKASSWQITSYSKIKQNQEAEVLEAPGSADVDQPLELPPDQLPPGAASGRFLHEILERVPLGVLDECPSAEFFGQHPRVKSLVEEARRRYERSPTHLLHAVELVHRGLTAPITLGEVTLPGGIGRCAPIQRELEFLYPIPEVAHPSLLAGAGPVQIERGFIKGYIDAVFVHQGRSYVLDWKSDLLPAYDPASLAAHVGDAYRIQAELYTLAVLKLLGIDSEERYQAEFGGVVYCFLRGLAARPGSNKRGTDGIYFRRATFAEVLASEVNLRRRGDLS